MIDAIARTPAFAQARLIERLSQMEKKRDEIQKEIAQLKLSQPLRLTKDEIKDWLRKFSAGDVRDPDFRRWVVDVLISAVYVYDDKIVVFYSLRGVSPITFGTAQPLIEEKDEEIQAFSSSQKFGFDGRCSTKTKILSRKRQDFCFVLSGFLLCSFCLLTNIFICAIIAL